MWSYFAVVFLFALLRVVVCEVICTGSGCSVYSFLFFCVFYIGFIHTVTLNKKFVYLIAPFLSEALFIIFLLIYDIRFIDIFQYKPEFFILIPTFIFGFLVAGRIISKLLYRSRP